VRLLNQNLKKSYIQNISSCGKLSMHPINLKEAESHLAELIEAAASGQEVVIVRSDGTSFKIVPINPVRATPKFGSAKGLVRISDDFDEPLEEFGEYAP
jgi:antitoxin (DNA-binding transcriptional repressor) of toxin-antitoxin stability system